MSITTEGWGPFSVSETAFESVAKALANGSKTLAAAELKYFANSSDQEAQAWIEHLLTCAGAWPMAKEDEAMLRSVAQAFSGIEKPDHFTSFMHCDECKEHDDTLRARTRETLQRKDLGNAGWDPITFCHEEGLAYLFPTLARFALLPDVWRDYSWYGAQLISHLSCDGVVNRFLAWCSTAQQQAVYAFLKHLMETRAQAIASHGKDNELLDALSAWNPAT